MVALLADRAGLSGRWNCTARCPIPGNWPYWGNAGFSVLLGHCPRTPSRPCSTCICMARAVRSTPGFAVELAEEIRRLLHQFAAGFLKEPDSAVFLLRGALKTIRNRIRYCRGGTARVDPDSESTSEELEAETAITWRSSSRSPCRCPRRSSPLTSRQKRCRKSKAAPVAPAQAAPVNTMVPMLSLHAQAIEAASDALIDEQEDEFDPHANTFTAGNRVYRKAVNAEDELVLFPTPTTGKSLIRCDRPSLFNRTVSVNLYSTDGRLVYSENSVHPHCILFDILR